MDHKTLQIENDWKLFESPFKKEHEMLKLYVNIIDMLAKLLGFGEIMIVDYLRRSKKHITSYHHSAYGLAVDIRVRDKPIQFYWFMVAFGKLVESLNPRIRIQPHWELYGQPQQHIHIEIRTH